jgi:hypothetical protein
MVNGMTTVWKWMIVQRLWMAMGAVGLLVFSYRVAGVAVSSSLVFLVFVGTWFLYRMQKPLGRWSGFGPNSPWPWLSRYGVVAALGIAGIGVWLLWNRPVLVWLWAFAMPAVFYAMRLSMGRKNLHGLRSIPRIKIVLVALVWTSIAMLPWVQWQHFQEFETSVYAAMIFCWITVLTIPFDIRDQQLDVPSMKTIGQTLPARHHPWVLIVLTLIASRGAYFLWQHRVITATLLLLFIFIQVLSLALALYASGRRSIWLFEGLLDGMLVLMGVAYWVY